MRRHRMALRRRYGHSGGRTRRKFHIGDVAVTPSGWANPYHYTGNPYSIGDQRVSALRACRDGVDTGLQLWYAPSSGGARHITAKQVDWSGLR
jgi:hypothetical protein